MNDTNTPAFISPGTFEIDGESRPGLITAFLWGDGQLEIAIQPLCQLPYPIEIKVVLDERDLRSVNALLRAQAGDKADEAGNETLDELTEATHAATPAAS